MPTYPALSFDQYEAVDDPDDDLILFAAPARAIWGWAGIPRKGWRVRMLYQRWITDSRKAEVTNFWDQASTPRDDQPKRYLVGPTALTVALLGDAVLSDGQISLDYDVPFDFTDAEEVKLAKSAGVVLEQMRPRLDDDELAILQAVEADPHQPLPELEHNYVLESLCQIAQACADAEFFVQSYELGDEDVTELVQSLEALCRPALVVDGQHRLYGAAHAGADIWLPVVAVPNSPWMEQIYQFVVINEKAQRVETSLLTDIFGSSLTPTEQKTIRIQMDRSGVQVEERIAAVIASRDEASPFFGMVNLKMPGAPTTAYIPEATIRQLIEGGRGSRGWRTDEEFFAEYVSPTVGDRAEWQSWSEGHWRPYWFTFWATVRDFYNGHGADDLWSVDGQTNLTKAVTLRLLQRLFIAKAVERVRDIERTREMLVEALGEEVAAEKIAEKIAEVALPSTLEGFRDQVTDWFLENGVPVRVFTKGWVSSLDDAQGQQVLFDELLTAFEKSQRGERYHARNKEVFTVEDD